MDKFKLFVILLRYCESLNGASGKTIITNYGRMREFVNNLNEEELGSELCNLIERLAIKKALKSVREGKINLKESSTDWNKEAIAKGYQLSREVDKLRVERPNSEELIEKMTELAELAIHEPSIGTQLCLMALFFKGAESLKKDLEELCELYEID